MQMSDLALVLGASDIYPALGSTLQSCCCDMVSMKEWYAHTFPQMAGSPFRCLMDARYTKALFFDRIREVAKSAKVVAIAISSHGTTIPKNDVNHAAMVFADSDWNNLDTFGFDTDFAALFAEFPNVHFYVTADACESGPLAFKLLDFGPNRFAVNKFIEPPSDLQMEIDHIASGNGVTATMPRAIMPVMLPNVAYLSGTGGKGFYSIDEGDNGAFTKHLIKLGADTGQNYAALLDKSMDSQQQPQAHGGLADSIWLS